MAEMLLAHGGAGYERFLIYRNKPEISQNPLPASPWHYAAVGIDAKIGDGFVYLDSGAGEGG